MVAALIFAGVKGLPHSNSSFSWNKDLVAQVQFIKEHLRYPVRRRLLLKALSFAPLLPLVLWPLLFRGEGSINKPQWPLLCLSLLGVLLACMGMYRFGQTLKFVVVKTPFGIPENTGMLKAFLSQLRFAHSRHPEAPEIFQMLSKNIGGKSEAREVVIFIADEKRILVNSHFTGGRAFSPVGLPHYKTVAKMLEQWLVQRAGGSGEIIAGGG